jgi:hypothetical protein
VLLRRVGFVALGAAITLWLVVTALMLRRPIFATHDTMISYAHVWYVSHSLWHGHGIPVHMPVLGHGAAYAFPYASVPWLSAAIVRPLLGDRVVAVWLLAGAVGAIVATFVAFPELRSPWWATAVMANPAILIGALNGQLPFLWAATALLLAIAAWRGDRRNAATALAAVAHVIHPAVVLPMTAILVAGRLPFDRHRAALVVRFAISVAVALPAVWVVLHSSTFADTSTSVKVVTFIGTISQRLSIVVGPIIFAFIARYGWRVAGPLATAAAVIANACLYYPLDAGFGVRALQTSPDASTLAFIDSPAFVPGATYRLLRASDAKLGMYEMIQHGARLDSDFFPEDIHRSNFPDVATYKRFLRERRVDYVVIFRDYERTFHTNERRLLRTMAAPAAESDRFVAYPVRAAATVPATCPSC